MRVECKLCGEKYDNRNDHTCATKRKVTNPVTKIKEGAKGEAKPARVVKVNAHGGRARPSTQPKALTSTVESAKPVKVAMKTWADNEKSIEAKLKEKPDDVGLRITALSVKRMAERERAEAFHAEQTKLLPHEAAKTSTARTRKWRSANADKAKGYMKDYMRKRRAKPEASA